MAKSKPVFVRKAEGVIKAIKDMTYRHPTYQIFQDFLEVSAISISNCVDWGPQKEREKRYLEIINQYSPEEQKQLANILTCLMSAMQSESEKGSPTDILGEVFHGLELHNKYHGQFFTPFHICEFMGEVTVCENGQDIINEQGYISLCEPCVGSAGMVLGFAAAMHRNGMNYQENLCVTACDIDIKCVHMAYLQLSLYGIPAVIIHGNSLSMEEWSRWYTPAYMLGCWAIRERKRGIEDVALAVKEKTASKAPQQSNEISETKDVEFKLLESGQYSLF